MCIFVVIFNLQHEKVLLCGEKPYCSGRGECRGTSGLFQVKRFEQQQSKSCHCHHPTVHYGRHCERLNLTEWWASHFTVEKIN